MADFGITRVARHTGLDRVGIPVWCAYAPNARSVVVAQGKGLSDEDARASAVMEALERAVAEKPTIETVFGTASQLLETGKRFDLLPGLIGLGQNDIALDEEIEWAIGRDLLAARPVHVPVEAAVLDQIRAGRFWVSSDGLASGNTPEEAVFHGILERIERDAYVLWQVGSDENRFARCVDARGFSDPEIDQLLCKIDAAGLVLRLFDITSDIGVPCFTALLAPGSVSGDADVRFVEVTGGSGAHPLPVRAVIRAITECVQSRLTYISGGRDDISPSTFSAPLPAQTRRAFKAFPRTTPLEAVSDEKSLEHYLDDILCAFLSRDITSVIALPLSAPDLPFSVVKMFIPSLESPAGKRARQFGSRAISAALMS